MAPPRREWARHVVLTAARRHEKWTWACAAEAAASKRNGFADFAPRRATQDRGSAWGRGTPGTMGEPPFPPSPAHFLERAKHRADLNMSPFAAPRRADVGLVELRGNGVMAREASPLDLLDD
jgi:hypothetical protein